MAIDFNFLNVSQGDAYLISNSEGSGLLIDSGEHPDLLLNYVSQLGVDIKWVILTHNDFDHVAGIIEAAKQEVDFFHFDFIGYILDRPEWEITYEVVEQLQSLKELGIVDKLVDLSAEEKPYNLNELIRLDGEFQIEVLNPNPELVKQAVEEGDMSNAVSMVIRCEYKKQVVLFGADLELESWFNLMESELDLKANVFTVSHHGAPGPSKKRTGENWRKWNNLIATRINPNFAFISVGTKNTYNHPLLNAIEPFKSLGNCVIHCSNVTEKCKVGLREYVGPKYRENDVLPPLLRDTACMGTFQFSITYEGELIPLHVDEHQTRISEYWATGMCK